MPIESNPEVINAYIEKLGFPTALYKAYDVLSTEDWALEMVPRPVVGVVMLFPIKAASEAHRKEEAERIAKDGQVVSDKLFYMKQTVGNACGTIGLLHIVSNLSTLTGGEVSLAEGSFFEKFVSDNLKKNPDERAEALEKDDSIEEVHEAVAQEGQSEVVEDTWQHFIAFVNKEGHLYELDGRKDGPINHGATSDATLLEDSVKVVREFMARDPGELRFTIVAIAANTGDDE